MENLLLRTFTFGGGLA